MPRSEVSLEQVLRELPRVTIVDADKISDEAAAAVAEVWQTVNGALRVKLHDKHAALASIGRYLSMFDDKAKVDAVYGISEDPHTDALHCGPAGNHALGHRSREPGAHQLVKKLSRQIKTAGPLPSFKELWRIRR